MRTLRSVLGTRFPQDLRDDPGPWPDDPNEVEAIEIIDRYFTPIAKNYTTLEFIDQFEKADLRIVDAPSLSSVSLPRDLGGIEATASQPVIWPLKEAYERPFGISYLGVR